jgi:hypothetical protein
MRVPLPYAAVWARGVLGSLHDAPQTARCPRANEGGRLSPVGMGRDDAPAPQNGRATQVKNGRGPSWLAESDGSTRVDVSHQDMR